MPRKPTGQTLPKTVVQTFGCLVAYPPVRSVSGECQYTAFAMVEFGHQQGVAFGVVSQKSPITCHFSQPAKAINLTQAVPGHATVAAWLSDGHKIGTQAQALGSRNHFGNFLNRRSQSHDKGQHA